jgi:hypothetical protein
MQQISSQDPVTISLGTTGNMAFSRVTGVSFVLGHLLLLLANDKGQVTNDQGQNGASASGRSAGMTIGAADERRD